MPHPQDVAVPSLPEPFAEDLDGELWGQNIKYDAFTADQMNTRWLEGYEAGRAAGRASAEPERVERAEPCQKPGCNAHWGITCSEGHMRLKNCRHWCAPTPTASIAPKAEGEAVAKWIDASNMPDQPRGWYWGRFPGSWFWYSPERNQTRSIDHGDTLWHELVSGHYWGPFQPSYSSSEQLDRGAAAAPVAQAAAGASALRAAAEKLLALKDERDRLKQLHAMGHGTDYTHYHREKPLAWEALRAALSPRPEADADRASGGGVWLDIETAPEGVSVLACNSLGYVGRAVRVGEHWNGIGKPNGWMPMPKARATPTTKD